MSNILVSADTAPTILGTITHNTTGLPVSLAGCTVRFQMRQTSDRRFRIDAECVIEDETTGSVSYDLSADDLDFSGECLARFLVIYPDNRKQHTVPPIEITVEMQ